jgi:SAM-dependent methyltransferase
MQHKHYNKQFFELIRKRAELSAKIVVPLVLRLISARRVVDVGCGEGVWLSVFRELGVPEVLGVDGDYIDRQSLQIPIECFQAVDLKEGFRLDRRFDLCVSLEVAEHLPAAYADVFVQSLVDLAPVILFSAAIPFQGGNQHLNEQWPDKWAELFAARGYVAVDCIRKQVWENPAVEWWYAQNILLYVDKTSPEHKALLMKEGVCSSPGQLALVHPRKYLELVNELQRPPGIVASMRMFYRSVWQSLRWRLSRKVREAGIGQPPSIGMNL